MSINRSQLTITTGYLKPSTLSGSLPHKKSCPLRQLFHFHHTGLTAALLAVATSRSGLAAHLAVFQHGYEVYRIAGIIHTLCLQ